MREQEVIILSAKMCRCTARASLALHIIDKAQNHFLLCSASSKIEGDGGHGDASISIGGSFVNNL